MIPPALINDALALQFILRVYLKWGHKSLYNCKTIDKVKFWYIKKHWIFPDLKQFNDDANKRLQSRNRKKVISCKYKELAKSRKYLVKKTSETQKF